MKEYLKAASFFIVVIICISLFFLIVMNFMTYFFDGYNVHLEYQKNPNTARDNFCWNKFKDIYGFKPYDATNNLYGECIVKITNIEKNFTPLSELKNKDISEYDKCIKQYESHCGGCAFNQTLEFCKDFKEIEE